MSESNKDDLYDEVKKLREQAKDNALKMVLNALPEAIKVQIDLLSKDFDPEQVAALRLRLDASKSLAKLGGMEVEQHKHSGEIGFVPVKFVHEVDEKSGS